MRRSKQVSFLSLSVLALLVMPAQAERQNISCDNKSIVAKGNGDSIIVHGDCKSIMVLGNENSVTVEYSDEVHVAGDDNTVRVQGVKKVNLIGTSNIVKHGGEKPAYQYMGDGNQLVSTGKAYARAPQPAPTPKSAPKPQTPAKRVTRTSSGKLPNPAKALPPGVENMWFIYNSNSGGKWAVMTFKNGEITRDVNTVMENGIAASKRKNPNDWGRYTKTKKGEQLVVKFPKYKKARNYFITDRSIVMNSDFKLKGCWQAVSISNLGTSSTFSDNEFCFEKNGRFSNDSSFVVSDTPGNMSTALQDKHGTYRISGNSVILRYASGRTLTAAFGAYRYDTPHIFAISVGRRIYH